MSKQGELGIEPFGFDTEKDKKTQIITLPTLKSANGKPIDPDSVRIENIDINTLRNNTELLIGISNLPSEEIAQEIVEARNKLLQEEIERESGNSEVLFIGVGPYIIDNRSKLEIQAQMIKENIIALSKMPPKHLLAAIRLIPRNIQLKYFSEESDHITSTMAVNIAKMIAKMEKSSEITFEVIPDSKDLNIVPLFAIIRSDSKPAQPSITP